MLRPMQSLRLSVSSAGALESLLAARPAFGDSTEAEGLFKLTDRHLRPGSVDWLEVGAGDGRHLLLQMQRLSTFRNLCVVAIEPEATASPTAIGVSWLKSRLEDYQPDRQFDWINMRHSGYYIHDLAAQIRRISGSLSAAGMIALTHWSRGCVLRRLHLDICGQRDDLSVACVEELGATLSDKTDLNVLAFEQRKTDLLVHKVVADPTVAVALYNLARRGRPPHYPSHDPVEFIRKWARNLPSGSRRQNSVLLMRRKH